MYYKEIQWLEEFVRQVEDGYYTGKTSAQRAYKALAGAYDSVNLKEVLQKLYMSVSVIRI